jgi:nickel transport protein
MHPPHPQATRIVSALALSVALGAAAPALAHKVVVFATVDGQTIRGEAYFRGGDPVRSATVSVVGPDRAPLGETTTDDEGKFTFPIRSHLAHTLIVDAGEGHAGEYTVSADELPGDLPDAPSVSGPAVPEPTIPAELALETATASTRIHEETLEAEVNALAGQVAALRKDLDQYKNQLRLQDLLGGVGYILGLMGLAFYFLGVRRREDRSPPKD